MVVDVNKIIARNIIRFREARGMTQAELAKAVGVKRPTVTQWEAGKGPGKNTLPKIAQALGVTVDDLYKDAARHEEGGVLRFADPEFIRKWNAASPEVREDAARYLEFLLERQERRRRDEED